MLCILASIIVRNKCQDTYFILYNSTSVETVLPLNSAKRSNYIFEALSIIHETQASGYHHFKKCIYTA